jgi:SAM-dependent methyltransferase
VIPNIINNELRHDRCPCCQASDISKVGDIGYGEKVLFSSHEISLQHTPELWRCEKCKSSFTQNILPEDVATSRYAKGTAGERWSRVPIPQQKPLEVVHELTKYFQTGLRVLDIGCNTGELLDFAKSRGCITAGVEFSDSSRIELEKKGHQAYSSFAEIGNRQFDVITAFDLIEHLYDVRSLLASCRDELAENGVLIILTGNINSSSSKLCGARWWYVKYPEHIVFPSVKFISEFPGLELVRWVPTYSALGYRSTPLKMLMGLAKYMLSGRYAGLPSLGPDHALIVLRRRQGQVGDAGVPSAPNIKPAQGELPINP